MSPRRRPVPPTEATPPPADPTAVPETAPPAADPAPGDETAAPPEPPPQRGRGKKAAGKATRGRGKKAAEKAAADKNGGAGTPGPPSRDQRIKNLFASVKKTFGTNVIFSPADQVEYAWDLRRPTGIWQLDVDLAGGWPADCLVQITGSDGVGKTQLGLMTLAAVQSIYQSDFFGVYATHGLGLNLSQARGAGAVIPLQPRELERKRREHFLNFGFEMPAKIEAALMRSVGRYMVMEVGEGDLALKRPSEAMMDALIEVVRANVAQVVFLDEGAGTIPTADRIAKPLSGDDQSRVGDQAGFVAEFLRKLTPALKSRFGGKPNETTILFTSQRRVVIGATKYQKQTHAAGGMSLGYYKAIDVDIWMNQQFKRGEGERAQVIGRELGYRLTKGKLNIHEGASGLVHLYFNKPGLIDRTQDIFESCKRFGLLKGSNKSLRIERLNGEVLARTEDGPEGVRSIIATSPQLLEILRSELFRTIQTNWRHL